VPPHAFRGPLTKPTQFISFVLPVYDEAGNLAELHRRITATMDSLPYDYELLFVDDGSTDGSFEIMAELHRSDQRVRVIRLRRNFGKAAAYSAGFEHARGDVIITMDTDLQDDPQEIPLLIEKIDEGFDLVSGWKYQGKGPWHKSIPSKVFNIVVRFMTGLQLHDFNCPLKAYRKEVLAEINLYGELHRYIPVLASAKGFTMTEVKVSNLPRHSGKSKYGLKRHLRGMLDLLTIIFITRFARRPMHALGYAGIAACGMGFSILFFFLVCYILFLLGVLPDEKWDIHDRPALSLGILLMVVGVQFFSLGLLGELLINAPKAGDRPFSVRQILDNRDSTGPST